MKTELNTLLITLYVHLDDRILPAIGFTRDHTPGRKPALNDVELLCLLVAQHLLGIASDRKWIRYARAHLRGMFPNIPKQSGWGKRVRQSTGLLSAVITELARDTPSWDEATRLIDSTPVPCAASRETVKRSDLAGHAGYGYCASHSRFFWGFRLYLLCTPDGMPVVWGLANPKIGEREVTEALLRHDRHLIQPGQVIVGDKGFAGREFETFVTDALGAHLVRPDRKDENHRFGKVSFNATGYWPPSPGRPSSLKLARVRVRSTSRFEPTRSDDLSVQCPARSRAPRAQDATDSCASASQPSSPTPTRSVSCSSQRHRILGARSITRRSSPAADERQVLRSESTR